MKSNQFSYTQARIKAQEDEIVITYTFTDNPEHLKRTKETTLQTENQIEQAEKSASSYIVSSCIFSHFPPR
ncbi:MAG: hypothetical protein PUJ49_00740 [bacterium]|nr:hypothetical protein [bacterium]